VELCRIPATSTVAHLKSKIQEKEGKKKSKSGDFMPFIVHGRLGMSDPTGEDGRIDMERTIASYLDTIPPEGGLPLQLRKPDGTEFVYNDARY
jgi:hypothetical protein